MSNLQMPKAQPVDNFKQLVYQTVELFEKRDAFLVKDHENSYHSITFKQFKDEINALGTALIDLGLKDSYIAVVGENRYEWCLSYLAIACGIGVVVPIDKELPTNEIANLLNRSRAKAVIYAGSLSSSLELMVEELETVEYFINMDDGSAGKAHFTLPQLLARGKILLEKGDTRYLDAEIDSNAMGILLFTSGTTGIAKGVMLSQKNICFDISCVAQCIYFDCTDSVMSILPLHHTYECTCGFLTMFFNGVRISFCESTRYIARDMQIYKPTILLLVPLILESVYKKILKKANANPIKATIFKSLLGISSFLNKCGIDVRSKIFKAVHKTLGGNLRLVISGAAAIDPKVSSALAKMGLNIRQGYGLTECSPIVCVNRDKGFSDASIGQQLPGVEVRINNPNEDGIGEIITRGQNVMIGYFEDQAATDAVLKDGWLYTGDLGKMDENGLFYITGRLKNIIITKNGKNIYPEELETYLSRIPYVLESLVWGKDDDESGETRIHATIVPDMDAIMDKTDLNSTQIKEIHKLIWEEVKKINRTIPISKNIKVIDLRLEEFEKTTTKKIKRHSVKKDVAC